MTNWILGTRNDVVFLFARLVLAAVILPHGLQKALGALGGYGFAGTMGYFRSLGIPSVLGALVIALEFLGPAALAFGIGGRIVAAGLGATMVMAAVLVHARNGFFMNWFGNQKGEGVEFFVLATALALIVVFGGSGAFSVDYHLAPRS